MAKHPNVCKETVPLGELIEALQGIARQHGPHLPVVAEWEGQWINLSVDRLSVTTTARDGREQEPLLVLNTDGADMDGLFAYRPAKVGS